MAKEGDNIFQGKLRRKISQGKSFAEKKEMSEKAGGENPTQ